MFNMDRFSPDDNPGLTYYELSGRFLEVEAASKLCIDVFQEITDASLLQENYEILISVKSCLIEKTIALHEIGEITEEYCVILRELRATHRLGIISDIWSKSNILHEKFRTKRIYDLFGVIIFSSDAGFIKPSHKIFDLALTKLAIAHEKVVYIGNSSAALKLPGLIRYGLAILIAREMAHART